MTGSGSEAGSRAAAWQRSAPHYETSWRPVTSLYVPSLLDAVRARSGMRLLDLACGPGFVAEQAVARGCEVVGADFSSAMIRLASLKLPRAAFVSGDAHALPFSPEVFDAVVINFGVHHFADPLAALAAVASTLRPSGRLAYTVWAGPGENRALGEIERAFEIAPDIEPPSDPPGPPPPLGDRDRFRPTLAELGYHSGSMELAAVERHWRPEKAEDVFEAELKGGGRGTELLARQSPAVRAEIRAAVVAAARRFESPEGIAIPMTAYVISAERAR